MIRGNEEEEITPRELISRGLNSWEGWTCMAGVEQIVINERGEVLRGWCRQGGVLGTVADQMVAFPVSGYTCGTETCKSMVDIACSKFWY